MGVEEGRSRLSAEEDWVSCEDDVAGDELRTGWGQHCGEKRDGEEDGRGAYDNSWSDIRKGWECTVLPWRSRCTTGEAGHAGRRVKVRSMGESSFRGRWPVLVRELQSMYRTPQP